MLTSADYPSISVIIPSFNQGQYIEETLLSIVGQCYPNLEIIVIDGGSTDETIEVVKKYADKIVYWHSKPDKGQADAINQGMNLSSGEVVCWLNSDDMYLPKTLLDIGSRLKGRTHKNCLIYGATVAISQDEEKGNPFGSIPATAAFDRFHLTYFDFIAQPSTFWTRALWQATGELNIDYHYVLDWDWFIRASKLVDFEYVRRFYSVYRYHPLHKTRNGGLKRRQEVLEIVKTYSSDYWSSLYSEVEMCRSQIQEKLAFLNQYRVPKRHLLLPLFFPKINHMLKKNQDLFEVLTMYG